MSFPFVFLVFVALMIWWFYWCEIEEDETLKIQIKPSVRDHCEQFAKERKISLKYLVKVMEMAGKCKNDRDDDEHTIEVVRHFLKEKSGVKIDQNGELKRFKLTLEEYGSLEEGDGEYDDENKTFEEICRLFSHLIM